MTNNNNLQKSGEHVSPLALYIHIPFCHLKCAYCDFLSFAKQETLLVEQYISALINEMRKTVFLRPITSIFIGGGTPSILNVEQLDRLLTGIQTEALFAPDIEFSIEANPGTVTKEKLTCLKEHQVNRISFGVQTFQDEIGQRIGRIHSVDQAIESIEMAKQVGFENINVDLMFGLPGQTVAMLQESMAYVKQLSVPHMSVYALILEEGTALWDDVENDNIQLPCEEEVLEMMDFTEEYLENNDYHQYEISNFARNGYECQHNMVYWRIQDYIGIGLGSAGALWQGSTLIRKKNTSNLKEYIEAMENNIEVPAQIELIQGKDLLFERIMLGLRMNEGITWKELRERFHYDALNVYDEAISKNVKNGLLYIDEQKMKLTKMGRRLQNRVLLDFM